MAKRPRTEDHLATLKQLRTADHPAVESLESLLASPKLHGIVVSGAAHLARQWTARRLEPTLQAAAESLSTPEGMKRDPGCAGKLAVLRTLAEWESNLPALFVAAARWVQREPVQKGSIDTAAECRGIAALGLARTRPPEALLLLVDLLADPEPVTRQLAAMALGMWRDPEAIPLLRLKARSGDEHPDVLGETLMSLLRHDAGGQLAFVGSFLQSEETRIVEAAAVALGQSREPAALSLIAAAFQQYRRDPIHTSLLMAIALLRTNESLAWLVNLIAESPPTLGIEVLDALRIYRGDPHATAPIKTAAERHPQTAAAYREIFR